MPNPIARLLPLVALLALAGPARASEEEIHPWKQLVVTVDAGRGLGTVEVTARVTPPPRVGLVALSVRAQGRTVTLPAAALRGLPAVELATLSVHSEAGYDKTPWLHVVLQVPKASVPSQYTAQWIYVSLQGGQLKQCSIKSLTPANQYRFENRPLR